MVKIVSDEQERPTVLGTASGLNVTCLYNKLLCDKKFVGGSNLSGLREGDHHSTKQMFDFTFKREVTFV